MIDEDRSTWTLGQLADEVIEACELPMGCRGTIIAALGDAKDQGHASGVEYAERLHWLLGRMAKFAFEERWAAKGLDEEAQKLHDEVHAVLAKNPNPSGLFNEDSVLTIAEPSGSVGLGPRAVARHVAVFHGDGPLYGPFDSNTAAVEWATAAMPDARWDFEDLLPPFSNRNSSFHVSPKEK